MEYEIILEKSFFKSLAGLTVQEQRLIYRKIDLLKNDIRYGALRSKRIRADDELRESSVNMDIRLIWQKEGNRIFINDVGHHDDMLKKYG